MRLGIVGPPNVVDKITQVVKQDFQQIKPIPFVYVKDYTEVPTLIQNQQSNMDALLFAGQIPMVCAQKHIKPEIPWEYLPRNGSSLLQTLLKISLTSKHNIYRISSDSYELSQLSETYEELGIDRERYQIFTASRKLFGDSGYIDYVCSFHEQQYFYNQVNCCITALHNVYERLAAQKIPVFQVVPTTYVIRQALHKLQLEYLMLVSQHSQIVAVAIRIDSPGEYSLFSENEYQYILAKTSVAKQVYLFAQRVQAAIVEVGNQEFLLFSTRKMLETATSNFENIELLQTVKNETTSTISLGVGYGQTAQEAKHHANLGMDKAGKLGGDMAFIVYDPKKIIGPLEAEKGKSQESPGKLDQKFLDIAEKSGISINTVFQLYSIIEREGKQRFTAADLAALAGVTVKTMNRILAKLALHGFCFEAGKRMMTKSGRPSRIIEFNLL